MEWKSREYDDDPETWKCPKRIFALDDISSNRIEEMHDWAKFNGYFFDYVINLSVDVGAPSRYWAVVDAENDTEFLLRFL